MRVQRNNKYVMQSADTNMIANDFQIIDECGKEDLHDFINRVYPHFNIKELVTAINVSLSIMAEDQDLTKAIVYNSDTSELIIVFFREDQKLALQRNFINEQGKRIVNHWLLEIPKPFRRQGYTKPVFKESLQQYVNMDLNIIEVYAALEDGGLVWGKYGFVAIKYSEVTKILEDARVEIGEDSADFKNIKSIYDSYYNGDPDKKGFPMILWANISCMEKILKGSRWHGELDLKNQEQYNNFEDYVLG